jgi:surface carbohydrate biosynthesis protein
MTSVQLKFERRGQVPHKVAVPGSEAIGERPAIPALPLLLPVEITSRELDAKILLGLFAAERGYDVIVGRNQPLKSPLLPRSIFLCKSVRRFQSVKPPFILGHSVVAMDEEGLVRFPDAFQSMRLETEVFHATRALLAWGRSNAEHWARLPNYDGTPIFETGNPRADLLRPELRGFHAAAADELAARHGPFVLVNTNFSIVNHFTPGFNPVKPTKNVPLAVFQQAASGLAQHKTALMAEFCALVPRLAAAIAPLKLIVRPHPSENHEPWHDVVREIPNAEVVFEGGVVPWLMAASCVVHNGCTSAIEARVLGTPAIAFRPVRSAACDLELPNAVSIECGTADQVIDCARTALGGSDPELAKGLPVPELLRHHIANLDGAFACERILAALERSREALLAPPPPRRLKDRAFRVLSYGLGELGRRFPVTERLQYIKHVFPGMPAAEIFDKVALVQRLLDRFHDIEVSALRDDAVRFRKASGHDG